jgi:hypothetical protein
MAVPERPRVDASFNYVGACWTAVRADEPQLPSEDECERLVVRDHC